MHQQVYHSSEIQAWEGRWFAQQNSAYGLMQQVAWATTEHMLPRLKQQQVKSVAVCCGQGNNAGDGYLIASYLAAQGYDVEIYAAALGESTSLQQAHAAAVQQGIMIHTGFTFQHSYDAYIDALFGIGLNRELSSDWQAVIQQINSQTGLKIAVDIPSGLQANTGQALPCAVIADYTFTALGLKAGLFTGQGKAYAGVVELISLLPVDSALKPLASLAPQHVQLVPRQAFGHKGSYGHVLVIGGHAQMGGAVMLSAEAAFHAGAGKVTVVCDAKHHTAILARAPNIMLRDINQMSLQEREALVAHVDAVSFGMGLGRNSWAQQQFDAWFPLIQNSALQVVLDADALWFLAEKPVKLGEQVYATPHPGEAATLLGISTSVVESDRIAAIYALQEKYAGQWVLKGSGSLILDTQLWICTAGNPGMGTGGMGDVLAGMIASLKAQLQDDIALHQIVTLHAQAGDLLAQQGERGLQAQQMSQAIYTVVNREHTV